jgi:hypothetical protein
MIVDPGEHGARLAYTELESRLCAQNIILDIRRGLNMHMPYKLCLYAGFDRKRRA